MPAALFETTPADLVELRTRLAGTRWPARWPGAGWEIGTDPDTVRRLVRTWATTYDWAAHQASINALPWHVAEIGDTAVSYLLFASETARGLPLVLTNGWPSSFFELVACPTARRALGQRR